MCVCEFCSQEFIPRPQVKKPRACKDCQAKRQRANEIDWRKRNMHLVCKKYHQVRRDQRYKKLSQLAAYISHCMTTGFKMINIGQKHPNFNALIKWILPILQLTGIRRANKFWIDNMDNFYKNLEGYLDQQNLQTSS